MAKTWGVELARVKRKATQGAGRADRIERVEYAIALLATVIAVVLYVAFARNAGGLWRDEINSVNLASTPSVAAMFRLAEFDSFPLLWTMLLRVWIAIVGAGDAALRVAGALGGLSVVAAAWIAARATGRAAPVASLAVIAAHPEVLRACGTVRAFGLGACVSVLALAALIRVAEAPTRARVLVAVAATVCSVQILFQNAVFVGLAVAGALLVAFVRGDIRRTWIPVAIGAVGALSMVPYLGMIGRVRVWSPLVEAPVTMQDIVGKLLGVAGAASPVAVACWAVLAAVAVAGGARALLLRKGERSRELDRGRALAGASLAVLAPVAFVVFLVRLSYRTESWYYVGLIVFVAVCIDTALGAALRKNASRLAVVALAGVALLGGAGRAWGTMHERQTILDQMAARISTEASAGDLVVVYPWFYALTLDRYHHGPAEIVTVPPLENRALHRYDLVRKRMTEGHAMAPVLGRMRAVLEAGGRVWVVGSLPTTPAGRAPPRIGPAPRPDTGWSVVPDLVVWSTEAGDFIRQHATSGRVVSAPAAASVREGPALAVVQGWRP